MSTEPRCIFKKGPYCVNLCGRATLICLIHHGIKPKHSIKGQRRSYLNMFELMRLFPTILSPPGFAVDCHSPNAVFFFPGIRNRSRNAMTDSYHLHTCTNIPTHAAPREINTFLQTVYCNRILFFFSFPGCLRAIGRLRVNYLKLER